jgi:hypothetical protein
MIFAALWATTNGFAAWSSAGGGSGAPVDATYVTLSLNGTLTSERQLLGTTNQIILTDAGAGSTLTLSLPQSIATTSSPQFVSTTLTGSLFIGSTSEFITVAAPATIRMSGRDNVIVELDTNANSTSDFCIRANGVATDVFCIGESGTVTLATLDGDDNTFVDIHPSQFDNGADTPGDGDCPQYQTGDTLDWDATYCGGGSTLEDDLPFVSGATATDSIYVGVPGYTWVTSGGAFVTANDIYLMPFHTVESITINQASFEVTSAGNPSDACRLGLYESDGNWQPGALVADWGQLVNDSTGWKHITSLSTTVAGGDYLIAMLCNSGPALRGYDGKSYITSGVSSSTTSGTRFINLMRVSAPSGTQYASGLADPGDEWDAVDLGATFNYGHYVMLRWSS